jgi:hypothetical protein
MSRSRFVLLVVACFLAAPLAGAENPALLEKLKGIDAYMEKVVKDWNVPGQPFQALVPWKPHKFRVREFSDVVVEFVVVDGTVTEMKQIDPSGEYRFVRK